MLQKSYDLSTYSSDKLLHTQHITMNILLQCDNN